MSVSQAIKSKLIDASLLRTKSSVAKSTTKADDDGGLFVSEDEGDEQKEPQQPLSPPKISITDTTAQPPAMPSAFGSTSHDKAPNVLFGQPTTKPQFGGNSSFGSSLQALSPTASPFFPQTSNDLSKVCKCLSWLTSNACLLFSELYGCQTSYITSEPRNWSLGSHHKQQ